MKKVIRFIGLTICAILVISLIATLLIPYFYKDEILEVATEKLGKQVKADISLSKVDVSIWGNFPNISIQLHDVSVLSSKTIDIRDFKGYSTDTALFANKVLLSFNVLDFLFENYVIKEIVVKDARMSYFQDSKSHHNWNFSIESDSTGGDMFIELSKIRFRNLRVEYHNVKSSVSAVEWIDKINFSGKFRGDDFSVDVYAMFSNREFFYAGKSYFPNSSFKCDASLIRDSTTYVVQNFKIETPIGIIISDGKVSIMSQSTYAVDINVNVETTVKQILNVLPKNQADSIAPYKLQSNIFVEGNLKGNLSEKQMPSLYCNIACTNGSVVYEKTKYAFTTKGRLKAANLLKLNTYEYTSTIASVTTGKSKLSLQKAIVTNMERPRFSVEGGFDVYVDDIEMLMKIEDYGIAGNFSGTICYDGSLESLSNFDKDFFKKNKIEADVRCRDVSISAPEDSPYDFQDVEGHFHFSDGNVAVDSLDGLLQLQPFSLQGQASGFISYLALDDVDTRCNLNCTIEHLNLLPFYEHYMSLSSSSSTGHFLGSIRFDAKKLDFDPYFLINATTIIRFTENAIELSGINATTLQGRLIGGAVSFTDMSHSQKRCVASGEIEKMSAKDIFMTFSDFSQDYVTSKQIDGLLSGDFKFSAVFDSVFNPLYPTIDAIADVVIEDGTLTNVKPLLEVGKKMNMEEEFKSVSFSVIKNTIRLHNDTLYIPDMKINASAFEISFAGTHNIENNRFNYYMTVFLKKTLSLKFRKKNECEDFGEIEKNTDGNFKVPLKVFGNPDDYHVEYDFSKSKQNVKESLAEQKSEWKEILNGDSDKQKQEKIEAEEPIQSGFEIEW